jgi:hypothetical protein
MGRLLRPISLSSKAKNESVRSRSWWNRPRRWWAPIWQPTNPPWALTNPFHKFLICNPPWLNWPLLRSLEDSRSRPRRWKANSGPCKIRFKTLRISLMGRARSQVYLLSNKELQVSALPCCKEEIEKILNWGLRLTIMLVFAAQRLNLSRCRRKS